MDQRVESMDITDENTLKWTALEDLAARDKEESEEFKYLVEKKGLAAVRKRRQFLEVE